MSDPVNWQAISAVAEALGAAGVIATLLYLAIQIRQANSNDRVDGLQQLGRDYANHSAVVMRDENVAAFIKGLNSYRDLTPEERVKFDICVAGYINVVEVGLYHAEVNRLDEVLEMLSNYLGPRLFAYPGLRDWWQHGKKGGFGESTQAWVDEEIQKNKDTEGFWEHKRAE